MFPCSSHNRDCCVINKNLVTLLNSVICCHIYSLCGNCVTAKQHLLAVGDSAGTLHILEIPWSLRQPTQNEVGTRLWKYSANQFYLHNYLNPLSRWTSTVQGLQFEIFSCFINIVRNKMIFSNRISLVNWTVLTLNLYQLLIVVTHQSKLLMEGYVELAN